ncbi:hypothetical protein [uncultured Deinococcus sp.]|uniref:hypothetical protein n=1 Tax=uncultured Deinococcus sp. TaxID=158789 RepID=UPI0025E1FDDB|nr:hypothetical protein [uncultured Deinococcus sp.]
MSALELLRTDLVALPVHSWAVDLTLEENRPLPRLEETILRLAQAGVREFSRFVQLLGVEERHLARAFGDLRLKAALSAAGGTYELTPDGIRLLKQAALRTLRRVSVRLWHDPYTNALGWADFNNDEVMTRSEQRESGLRALHAPVELREDELRERYREIQSLIQRNGLPDDEDDLNTLPERHLVSITPKGHITVFLPAELAVYRHVGTGQLTYLLKRNGTPDRAASLSLKDLAERNIDLVPFETLKTLSPEAQRLTNRLITLQRRGSVIESDDSRIPQLLQRALPTAQQLITWLSPFQPGGHFDAGLLRALRTRLIQVPNLHARIVLTSGPASGDSCADVQQLMAQLPGVETIQDRLQVHEMPEVFAEGIIVDHTWALIESRQLAQHPFKRELALPYNRIHFVSDSDGLKAFQESLTGVLTTSGKL